jgi:hypothetical protein
VEAADVGGALAEEADGDAPVARVLALEGRARGERQVAAHDAPAAHEVGLGVEEVHGPAQAARAARVLAEELRHAGLGGHAARQRDAVVAVGLEDVVLWAEGGGSAHGDGLLADVEVQEAADLALRIGACRFFLEAADQHHRPVLLDERVGVRGHVRLLLARCQFHKTV